MTKTVRLIEKSQRAGMVGAGTSTILRNIPSESQPEIPHRHRCRRTRVGIDGFPPLQGNGIRCKTVYFEWVVKASTMLLSLSGRELSL